MEVSRSRSSLYNMLSSFLYYFVNLLGGMIGRKVMLMTMGIEYQGISGLFGNIISMLGIAELGIGAAIVYHLYKPLKNHDLDTIAACMNFYRKCYIVISVVVAFVGGILVFFLDFFIGENSLPLNMQVVYLMTLSEVVVSYSFTYKRSILYADQKNYCVSIADTLYIFVNSIITIVALYVTHNYYLYLLIKIILRVLENIAINFYVDKKYSFLKDKKDKKISKDILDDIILKVKGLLFHKIGSYIVVGTDNILISKFIGLASVGVYSNYSMIVSAVEGLFGRIVDSTVASVGNLLVDDDAKKNMKLFEELQLVNLAITNFTTTSLLCLLTTFIAFYFGKDYTLNYTLVIVIVCNYMLNSLRKVYGVFKTAAGIQYEDRFVPLIEGAVNLIVSLLLINYFGFIGVFLGTVISNIVIYSYTFPKLIYMDLLGGTILGYIKDLINNILTISIGACTTIAITCIIPFSNLFLQLIIRIILCIIVPNLLFVLIYHKNPRFAMLKDRMYSLIKKRG